MWYLYPMEYYSAIKRIMPFKATWMVLETLILREVKSERERRIPYAVTYIWNLIQNKSKTSQHLTFRSLLKPHTDPPKNRGGGQTQNVMAKVLQPEPRFKSWPNFRLTLSDGLWQDRTFDGQRKKS